MLDRYTKIVLTVIAVALSLIAVRGLFDATPARASGEERCRIVGPVEVRVTQMPEWKVGTWSGRPFYVKEMR